MRLFDNALSDLDIKRIEEACGVQKREAEGAFKGKRLDRAEIYMEGKPQPGGGGYKCSARSKTESL